MKRTLLIFVFAVVSMIANAQLHYNEFTPVDPNGSSGTYAPSAPDFNSSRPRSGKGLRYNRFNPVIPEDIIIGQTYSAFVGYESSTGHENNYELKVTVNNNTVKEILFDNGGRVHAGSNNSGYTYYGGKLVYIEDIKAYTTVVTIVYPNSSWQRYTIVLGKYLY